MIAFDNNTIITISATVTEHSAEEMASKTEVDTLVDILINTSSNEASIYHTRTSGTPFFWLEALQDKDKGPLTDEDIEIIAEAKEKDPPSANEILPNLFLGNKGAAEDTTYLKSKGITHLLNMGSASKRSPKFLVVPDKNELAKEVIEVKNSPDWGEMKVIDVFPECGEWIQRALNGGGRVMVVCWQGASRSAAVILAYLVSFKEIPLKEATRLVKIKRDIRPHNTFLQQLIDYEDKIR